MLAADMPWPSRRALPSTDDVLLGNLMFNDEEREHFEACRAWHRARTCADSDSDSDSESLDCAVSDCSSSHVTVQPLTADCENPRLAINLGRVTDSSLTSPTVPLDFPGSLSGFSSAHAPGRDALAPGACEASVAWLATMGAAAGDAETGTDNQALSDYNMAHLCGNKNTDEKEIEKCVTEKCLPSGQFHSWVFRLRRQKASTAQTP